jgi:hypothetical protein
MNNVDRWGDEIYSMDFKYLLQLQEQLNEAETKKNCDNQAMRALKMKIKLIQKKLARK